MKTSVLFSGVLAQTVAGHYFFDKAAVDGAAVGGSFEYIRDFTRATKFNPIKFSSNPAADIRDASTVDGDDIRCNQGAFSAAGRTKILEVAAGSEISMSLGVGAKMEHPGPGLVYMSRAPDDDVKSYDGSGDWFKIFEEGVCSSDKDFTTDAWCTWGRDSIKATIPKDTPSGEYLFRAEHIGVHRSHVNQPEHYTSCVQVRVTGGGSGTPGPTFKLPGGYKDTDAYATFSIYGGHKEFPMPGPAVWKGGNAGGSTGGKDGAEGGAADVPADGAAGAPAGSATQVPAAGATKVPAAGAGGAADVPAPGAGAVGGKDDAGKDAGNVVGVKCAGMYEQCGGAGWSGATCCSSGSCKKGNDWYSQCL